MKTLESIKSEFEKLISEEYSMDEFIIFLICYPAYSVANADTNFDSQEEAIMSTITSNVIQEVYTELSEADIKSLSDAYVSDFKQIYYGESGRKVIEKGLKEYYKINQEISKVVGDLMLEMANASDRLSTAEASEIERINALFEN